MSLPELSYEKVWTSAEDFPTYEGSEEQVRLDNQYHPDAIKDYINNKLLTALQGTKAGEGAGSIGVFPVEALGGAATVQEAIETILSLITGVTLGAIPDGSITMGKLSDESVTSDKIADGAVAAAKLMSGAVTEAKLADNSVSARTLCEQSVASSVIKDGAVVASKMSTGAVVASKLAANSVSTEKILDAAVTADKLDPSIAADRFLAAGPMVLSSHQYGDELPAAGVPGRIFFKRVK